MLSILAQENSGIYPMSKNVAALLDKLGLGQYTAAFEENAIDWGILADVDQETLKDIGISAAGHRLRILKAITDLKPDSTIPAADSHRSGNSDSAAAADHDEDITAWSRTPGERKPVTMLFADIVDSTALTERLDAEEIHELLYGATRRMGDAVESNQGTVCRFMGDGIMAMFGAPVASERHALEASLAALDMQRRIAEYNQKLQANQEIAIQIRIGLHSGEVVVLEVGDDPKKQEYDATGSTVPLAARMEQIAENGTILMTAATRALAGDLIETKLVPSVMVKGISEPVVVYQLCAVHSATDSSALSMRSPFVGRNSEQVQFRVMLDSCLEVGHGQTLFVRGEAGIGKTRLVEEMSRIAIDRGFVRHKALVLDFGVGKGQEAVPSLVRSFLGIALDSGKKERELAVLTAESEGIVSTEQRVFLYDLLDITQPLALGTLYDAMGAEARNKGKRAAVAKILSNLAKRQPVLVVVEDLQWADAVTLHHLSGLSAVMAQCPALMVQTSRAEGDPIDSTWRASAGESPIVTWDLSPLRKEESVMLGTAFTDVSDSLAQRCIERAAGNPLFLEQLLLGVEKGTDETIPDSIKSLVLARMDQLPEGDKWALRAVSVLGQRFEIEGLRHLIEQPAYDCRVLVEHHLVRPEGPLYLFTHALIQGGAYGSLLKPQRSKLHLLAAEWFRERDPVLYAEHLDHAGDASAAQAYLAAAKIQSDHYRPERALQLVRRGLEIAVNTDHFELNCFEGELLQILWDVTESILAYRRALEFARDDIQRCQAMVGVAEGLGITQLHDELLDVLKTAEDIGKIHNLTPELARINQVRGRTHFLRGEIEDCLQANKLSLEYARKANSPEVEAQALSGLGDAEYNRGRFISSYRYFDQCIELARKYGFGRVIAANLSMRGYVSQWQNNIDPAADYHEAVEQATRTHDLRAEMLALVAGGAFWTAIGDLVESEKWLKRGLEITRQLSLRLFEGEYHYLLGRVAMQQGDQKKAHKLAQQAIVILQDSNSGMTFGGPIALGVLALTTADPDRQHSVLRQAESLLATGSVGHNYLIFYEDAMEVCLQLSRWDEVDKYAQLLEDYTRAEPLPRSSFFIARGRALASYGRGERNAKTMSKLQNLCAEADQAGLKIARKALEQANSNPG